MRVITVGLEATRCLRTPLYYLVNYIWPAFDWCFNGLYSILEWPFVIARRATIPLVESDAYDHLWFLVSLLLAPLFIMAYFEKVGARCMSTR